MAVAGQFLVYETAAQHGAKVVIDGQGADEFFAGYPRHQNALMADRIRRRDFSALAVETASQLRHDPRFFWDMWRLRLLPRLARPLGLSRREAGHDFLKPEAENRLPNGVTSAEAPFKSKSMPSALARALLTDVLSYNLKSVLALTDRNAMAHAIEARVPYVDRKIAEYAFSLPDRYKIGGGQRKRILRAIAARYLPRSIVSRVDRIGFGAPIEQWLTRDFRSELAALPDGGAFGRSSLVEPGGLRSYIDGFLAGRHRDVGTVWRLYAIDLWARSFAVSGL
jgi:asparagine synthase (glutamine-hydrolysing)